MRRTYTTKLHIARRYLRLGKPWKICIIFDNTCVELDLKASGIQKMKRRHLLLHSGHPILTYIICTVHIRMYTYYVYEGKDHLHEWI